MFSGVTCKTPSLEFLFSDLIGGPGEAGPLFRNLALGSGLPDANPLLLKPPLFEFGLDLKSDRGGIARPPLVTGDERVPIWEGTGVGGMMFK